MCQSALSADMLACQSVLVLTCSRALRAYLFMCKRAILHNDNSYMIQICWLYLGLKRGNIGETLVNYWDLLVC